MSAVDQLMETLAKRPVTIMVCYSKCWGCMFNHHTKAWHTWADGDDVAHALSIGHPDPSDQRCGCWCQAKATKPEAPKRQLLHKGRKP